MSDHPGELSMMALAIIAEGDAEKARVMLANFRRMQTDLNAAIRSLVVFVARNDTDRMEG